MFHDPHIVYNCGGSRLFQPVLRAEEIASNTINSEWMAIFKIILSDTFIFKNMNMGPLLALLNLYLICLDYAARFLFNLKSTLMICCYEFKFYPVLIPGCFRKLVL